MTTRQNITQSAGKKGSSYRVVKRSLYGRRIKGRFQALVRQRKGPKLIDLELVPPAQHERERNPAYRYLLP